MTRKLTDDELNAELERVRFWLQILQSDKKVVKGKTPVEFTAEVRSEAVIRLQYAQPKKVAQDILNDRK